MEEVTIKNYQELAMRTCLPSAKNWEYCYCLIASEIGEAFGKWGKKFRDGEFDKDKLTDELGDVFWGLALACELGGYSFEEFELYKGLCQAMRHRPARLLAAQHCKARRQAGSRSYHGKQR